MLWPRNALTPGVQGHAYLDFAELVLALGRADLYAEMLDIITTRQPSDFSSLSIEPLGPPLFWPSGWEVSKMHDRLPHRR